MVGKKAEDGGTSLLELCIRWAQEYKNKRNSVFKKLVFWAP